MATKFEQYETELKKLVDEGELLKQLFQYICYPEEVARQWREVGEKKSSGTTPAEAEKIVAGLKKTSSDFSNRYHSWYSEALSLITLMLPNRVDDFIALYKKPKSRKDISFENYVIEDALVGLRTTLAGEVKADRTAALPRITQQLAILKAVERRFQSTLFDLETLVQADIFDSEIAVAKELMKHKFLRAAGAVCGVIIEKHLEKVCVTHKVTPPKKNPTIADLNEALKAADVVDTVRWRQTQQLADVRNICVHHKSREPTSDEVAELIDGTNKLIKTLF